MCIRDRVRVVFLEALLKIPDAGTEIVMVALPILFSFILPEPDTEATPELLDLKEGAPEPESIGFSIMLPAV